MTWNTNDQPFGVNHAPTLVGTASDGSGKTVPVAVDKDTGELLVSTVSGGGTSSTFGAVFPATGTAVGATDGTNMQPLKVDGSNNLLTKVNAALPAGSNVIGHIIADAGSTTAVTQATAGNLNATVFGYDGSTQRALSTTAAGILNTTLTDGTNTMKVVSGTYGKPGLVVQPHDTQGITDGFSNAATKHVDENFNQISYLTQPLVYNGSTWDRAKSTSTGVQAVNINDGTNSASVVAGDSGFNGQAVASATKTYTFTTSTPGVQTILANTPTEGYSWIEIVYTSVGSGLALTGQFSTASGGTYINSSTFQIQNTAGTSLAALGVANNTIYGSIVHGNFFQIAVSALTSGTFAGTVTLRAMPPPPYILAVGQSGAWSISAATTGGYSFLHIAAGQATTTVKSGAGTLHAIVFNGKATATNVTTIYDNTAGSGTVIGIPDATSQVNPDSVIYDLAFATGLTIVTATANGPDMTVVYK